MKESQSAVMFAITTALILTGCCTIHDSITNVDFFVGILLVVFGTFLFGFTCGEINQARGRKKHGKTRHE